MSVSKHNQRKVSTVKPWRAPPISPESSLPLGETTSVASATECTGLEAQPILSDNAAESYTQLYGIHAQKPQGNIGKGNPNNDPAERKFHRTRE